MHALVYHKPKDVRYEAVPDPKILHARDIILKVTATSICGSDLHIYNGYAPQKSTLIMGHEFVGIVEEVGPRVLTVKKGDRVIVPFPIACGQCWFCERAMPMHCSQTNKSHYGPDGVRPDSRGGGIFGYGDHYGHYDGGQAEYVRVPYADFSCRKIPAGVPDEKVLFLTDIIPTGWAAAEWCDIKGGDTVAVFGCGPVGLMAMKSAWLQGAGRVIAIDVLAYRRDLAGRVASAETLDPNAADPVEAIRSLTAGRGADAVIDAVGIEADHGWSESLSNVLHRQIGSTRVLQQAMQAVRRGGALSIIGVYDGKFDNFPVGQIFEKGLRVRGGQAPVQPKIDMLLDMVVNGRISAEDIVTHRLPLEDGSRAYLLFNEKRENCVKVVLDPWEDGEAEYHADAKAAKTAAAKNQRVTLRSEPEGFPGEFRRAGQSLSIEEGDFLEPGRAPGNPPPAKERTEPGS